LAMAGVPVGVALACGVVVSTAVGDIVAAGTGVSVEPTPGVSVGVRVAGPITLEFKLPLLLHATRATARRGKNHLPGVNAMRARVRGRGDIR